MVLVGVVAPGREDRSGSISAWSSERLLRRRARGRAGSRRGGPRTSTAIVAPPARSRSALAAASPPAARLRGREDQPGDRGVGPLGDEARDRAAGADLGVVRVRAGDEDARAATGRQPETLGQGLEPVIGAARAVWRRAGAERHPWRPTAPTLGRQRLEVLEVAQRVHRPPEPLVARRRGGVPPRSAARTAPRRAPRRARCTSKISRRNMK